MVAPPLTGDNEGMETTQTFTKMWETRPPRIPKDQGGNAVLAGVAEGFGARYNIDPVIIRIAFVVLTLCFGGGLFLYFLCWINMGRFGVPFSPWSALATGRGNIARESKTGKKERTLAIWLLIGMFVFFPSLSYASDGTTIYSAAITFALFGLGWYLLYQRAPEPPAGLLVPQQGRTLHDAHPSGPYTAPGNTDAGGSTAWRADAAESPESPYAQSATANLTTPPDFPHPATPPAWDPLGAAPELWHLPDPNSEADASDDDTPPKGSKRSWWIAIAVVVGVLVLGVISAVVENGNAGNMFGGSNITTTTETEVNDVSETMGDVNVDYRDLPPLDQERTATLHTNIGNVDVVLPKDVPVEVRCSTNLGSTDCPTDTVNPDAPGKTLRINATTNIGNVTVREP